jgi:hypothetical protein
MALNNKKKTLLALATIASGITVLAGCSTVEAKLTDSTYNESVLDLSSVTNNTLGKIYDALVKSGDANSETILKNVLYLYSQTIYGSFFDTTDASGNTVKGLKSVVDAYEANSADSSGVKSYADAYAVYGGEIQKVVNFYTDVLYRLRVLFLSYVTNTTYQYRSQFQEKLFYDAQIKNYYKLASVNGTNYPYNQGYTTVDGSFRLSEKYAETSSFKLDGQSTATGDTTNSYFKNIFGTYQNYIENNLLPDIYRSELTTQYLYSQNPGQIKITSARKIDAITLATNSQYPKAVESLVKAYAKDVIDYRVSFADSSKLTSAQSAAKALLDAEGASYMDKYGFTFLGNLYKGTIGTSDAVAALIYADAGWTTNTLAGSTGATYYNESSFGTIANKYNKITENRFTNDTSITSDFTGSGAYDVDTGLAIKTGALMATDETIHGWYSSSTGVSGLTDALKKRLFKIPVANEVDSTDWSASTGYADKTLSYGQYHGGNYYLVPENFETSNEYPYIIYDSSNWYIVKVDEAVKSAKVSSDSTGTGSSAYYDNMAKHAADKDFYGEQVSRQIGYSLASSDTWKKAAEQYYLEQMALVYHDDYVYKYFKTTFPDIFD